MNTLETKQSINSMTSLVMSGKTENMKKVIKKVIDADNQKVLEKFDVKDTEIKLNYYKALGKWNDVSIDRDGDIILWEE